MGLFDRLRSSEEPRRRRRQRGGSGTINQDGYVLNSEYQVDLKNPKQAFATWERMRRSDPSVRETLWHMYAPVINADWAVHPPEHPDELELELAAFGNKAFFEWPVQPWTEFCRSALDYLTYGNMVFEEVLHVVEDELRIDVETPGEPIELPNTPELPGSEAPPVREQRKIAVRQFLTWRQFAPRLPNTIEKWNLDAYGELESITQQVFLTRSGTGGYEEVDIPAETLLVLVNERLGDDFNGVSVLRSAWKPWVFKEMVEKVAAISFERHGVGVPVAYIPREREADDALADELEDMLKNLRAGNYTYLLFPGPKTTGNIPGFDFEIVSPNGSAPQFKEMLEYYRGEIAGAMLARFKELGQAQTGARATANVQSEVWYNALHAIARYLEDVCNAALRRLIDKNYPNVRRYPYLKASGIEARNVLEFAQAMTLLANAKLLYPDTPTRAWIRGAVDAPGEDEEEAELQREQQFLQSKLETLGGLGFEQNPAETARPRNPDSSSQRRRQDGTK